MTSAAVNDRSSLLEPTAGNRSASSHTQSPARPRAISRGRLWTGRVLTGLTVLFLLADAMGKLINPTPAPVVDAFNRLGVPLPLAGTIAVLLLVCTILYAIPRTAVLGAVVLTGFLGGAISIHLRAGSPPFETVFPAMMGVITWAGILLREPRLGALFPLRSTER